MVDPTLRSNSFYIAIAWGAAFPVTLWICLVLSENREVQKHTGNKLLCLLGMLVVSLIHRP